MGYTQKTIYSIYAYLKAIIRLILEWLVPTDTASLFF